MIYFSFTTVQAPELSHIFLKARPLESQSKQALGECSYPCVHAWTLLNGPLAARNGTLMCQQMREKGPCGSRGNL